MKTAISAALLAATLSLASFAHAAPPDDAVARLQHGWEEIKYAAPPAQQEKRFEQLAMEADQALAQFPDRADVLIWHGIVKASYAGAKGGLGALSLAKVARKDFEHALQVDPNVLSGSAYTSLGSLYYQVPGWPIGFGSDKLAEENLGKGLALNPDGIDPNYFYGDYLYRNGKFDQAEQYLRRALQAPPRPNRQLADAGRRKEVQDLLAKIAEKRR